ncbi:TAT-variant-translocated molybdopterin oxidoreductase [Thalassoroseus pseudoceratinae]|uniref:TAT-variant-translocated molybdopterin oxidoreductase n=1 Tax=Thalassoroseus pseudoceratinae TaxID=2713176 RepID=UPI001420B5C2|nr:TAT-variant-translocated molybdopterin oxidoreductase [Thalassoroseus pseudoceratinae]
MPRKNGFENQSVSERLRVARGREYWRTLDEWADTEEFQDVVRNEFPASADTWTDDASRREFLTVMGASLALAGLSGCNASQPHEEIVPYVKQPEELIPGVPLYFATAMPLAGFGTGLLVESHMGRPTKVEGNPSHPAVPVGHGREGDDIRAGATDVFAQASILQLYDPDRGQTVFDRGQLATWERFLSALRVEIRGQQANQGRGLRVLTGNVTSPTVRDQIQRLLKKYPNAKWHQYESVCNDHARAGAMLAFGQDVQPIHHFDRADVVLSLDADFLQSGPASMVAARDFMARRNVMGSDGDTKLTMSRMYAIECTPTLTGAKADHRLAVSPERLAQIAMAIASRVGVNVEEPDLHADKKLESWIAAVAEDLKDYRVSEGGASLVVAGESQPPAVHALAHAINSQLGNIGKTVEYIEPLVGHEAGHIESLEALVQAMRTGEVETLLILDGNPVYSAPADLEFADALNNVPFRVHLGLHRDETSQLCHWHVPMAHFLETWGDVRAYDGTVSLMQPLISPLYDGRNVTEILAFMLGEESTTAFTAVQDYWASQYKGDKFEAFWQESLHNGVVAGDETSLPKPEPVDVALEVGFASADGFELPESAGGLTVLFRPDPTIRDGEFANNGWLQELPKPFTKLTWDNAALIGPKTADELGVRNGDMVTLTHGERTLDVAVMKLPGQPEGVITLHLGYGRTHAGRVGDDAGFNANKLRTSEEPWMISGVKLASAGEKYVLATTQHHFQMENRHLIRSGSLEELQESPDDPGFMHVGHGEPHVSMYPEKEYNDYKWGMVINQSACIGCNACTVACQSENNIPVVGKTEVARGREMHWLRIDTYYSGDPEEPETADHQPVACVHCEQAPCEIVCPVHATTHSPDGINEMTYNRCVGTRYCSNNCPYKVRRFNFLEYTKPVQETPVLQLLQNPDVTVRSRGVMEKCNYCVQRIQHAKIESQKEDRRIEDGEIVTACQAVCPTQSIIFGDLNDESSLVSQANESPLTYGLLEELNTRPRTRYGAVVRNLHPKLAALEPSEEAAHH